MPVHSVVLVRSSFSTYGGVEKIALDVIEALLQHGIDVKLLTWDAGKWPISHPRLQILPTGIKKGPRLLQAFLYNRGVSNYLKYHKPECVFSFDRITTFTHMHGGGGTHRTFLKIKNAHSSVISRISRSLNLFHKYTLYMEKKGFFNPCLKKVQCVSSLVKKDIIKDYGLPEEKMEVIPNGIDWNAIGEIFDRREKISSQLLRRHDLDPTRKYLLFLGSGFDRKGLDTAIRGLSTMPETYSLIVVGKGHVAPYRRLAKELNVGHRIFFTGPQQKGWTYAALCKALVLPSRYEPFGIAPAEANAMGIPVLISDQTGYLDWVQEGMNGVILNRPADQQTIADAFSRFQTLIEFPPLNPRQIRQQANRLDYEKLMNRLLFDFLEVKPNS